MSYPMRSESQADLPPPRERPWLLPYNRKIRHLQGITIRNLTLAATHTRSRGKTIDDEALPSTLKSPTKALAMRESKILAHSRSSSDLKATKEAHAEGNDMLGEPTTPTKPKRPGFGKGLRRRTTMEWANASPMTRQKKLEDITAVRMADTFFTLHADGHDEPIYISEIAEKAMNPNFKFFDLGPCGPGITRQDKLTVRVWAKSEAMSDWQYLMDYTVHFRSLQFIGKTLGNFRHPLPQNCVLFHMTDGIYTSFIDLPASEQTRREVLAPPKQNSDGRVLSTSSYDVLMRLSTLDDCIQDAIVTRDRIADEIESILETNRESIHKMDEVPETEDKLQTLEAAVEAERRRVKLVRRKRDDLQASIRMRRDKIHGGMTQQSNSDTNLPEDRAKHKETVELVEKLEEDIIGQRRRVCEDLVKLYPIEPVPGKSLSFTIRGLHLPNSEFDDVKEDETAAALSYVGQVVSQLCPYLSVILPYPIALLGSISTIEDPLAVGHNNQNNPRTYPLYMKGVVRYRFEYGVFLLNKNIEILSNALGLRPMDVRQTLPNLKYLLYVATAGKGELPARKAGGIRGLLRHDGFGSRKSSIDSTATASSFGSPALDFKKGLDSIGAKGSTSPKSNGSLVSAMSSLKQNAHTGSRLRPVD